MNWGPAADRIREELEHVDSCLDAIRNEEGRTDPEGLQWKEGLAINAMTNILKLTTLVLLEQEANPASLDEVRFLGEVFSTIDTLA